MWINYYQQQTTSLRPYTYNTSYLVFTVQTKLTQYHRQPPHLTQIYTLIIHMNNILYAFQIISLVHVFTVDAIQLSFSETSQERQININNKWAENFMKWDCVFFYFNSQWAKRKMKLYSPIIDTQNRWYTYPFHYAVK